ncbi:MAG: signal transduction protein [Boseongicola sp.]|nr:signal transduction protein [Boseongicola sp.]
MRVLLATCALFLALLTAVTAQSNEPTSGRELAELIYGSFEEDAKGTADMGEFVNFGEDIFVSIDYDEGGSIDPSEFTEWDFSFITADKGQERAYQTSQKIYFSIWDHNGDGEIAQREYDKSMVWDFQRADTNDDAF